MRVDDGVVSSTETEERYLSSDQQAYCYDKYGCDDPVVVRTERRGLPPRAAALPRGVSRYLVFSRR